MEHSTRQATKVMAVADRAGFLSPLGLKVVSGNEQKLVVGTLKQRSLRKQRPKVLIGDKAYDSDPLDAELAEIAPHPDGVADPDRRELCRCRAALVTRYGEKAENDLGLLQLACVRSWETRSRSLSFPRWADRFASREAGVARGGCGIRVTSPVRAAGPGLVAVAGPCAVSPSRSLHSPSLGLEPLPRRSRPRAARSMS